MTMSDTTTTKELYGLYVRRFGDCPRTPYQAEFYRKWLDLLRASASNEEAEEKSKENGLCFVFVGGAVDVEAEEGFGAGGVDVPAEGGVAADEVDSVLDAEVHEGLGEVVHRLVGLADGDEYLTGTRIISKARRS